MASLYTTLAAGLIFPLHERLKHHDTVAVRKHMEDAQWWSPERLEAFQLQRLRALLTNAQQHVPYYRELFAKLGCKAEDIRSLGDLKCLPFLTKPIIRQNLEQLKSGQAQGLARFNTGGSSGEPLIFFIGRERVSHDVAAKWRATRWWGVDIGDPEIVVWGSPVELTAQDRIRQMRDRLLRSQLLPAFEMSEANLDGFVATIRRTRPTMLFGYPSSLSLIARHAEKRGQSMDGLGIKVAFVTAERLYDHQRDDIARIFGCQVANGYGGRDAGFIAHQCPQGGMHITAEDIIVEIVDRDGNALPRGAVGEVVVTHMATGDFPFVRYRTGDVAILSDKTCACGRGLPMLEEIQGRTTDFVVAADGTIMHGLAVVYPIRDIPGIEAFKVVQETREHVSVQIVPGEGCGAEVEVAIAKGIKARLGQSVTVAVERVGEIPREQSGKYRYIVSHVMLT
ncbi:MAG: phenylacetate--CoA ligase family protein [Candidatus Accumulibacter sp.]|jgi:phenylacetate-CoA ligase|uniref:phenylacetate--CoA ligase family protein n=1 Tax=Candidatus Accumulibacter necessarius TaxID=2954386 RepID=UPI001AD203FB|nr:phenylacetate--CoA ligase family protein [Candidatus Accumulibacter necessarius]